MLSDLRQLSDRRILFFGGKGGVGKTTCASAVALSASRRGKRVLLVSTDPAHSTSDIFQKAFTSSEQEILPEHRMTWWGSPRITVGKSEAR